MISLLKENDLNSIDEHESLNWLDSHNSSFDNTPELEKWFKEQRLKDKITRRGLIIRKWPPQVLVLSHPETEGGFLKHSGWNLALEGVSAGFANDNMADASNLATEVLPVGWVTTHLYKLSCSLAFSARSVGIDTTYPVHFRVPSTAVRQEEPPSSTALYALSPKCFCLFSLLLHHQSVAFIAFLTSSLFTISNSAFK
ncbi:hypothetical protein DITRI_Ditri06bG0054900 [Diplodiscus trichospermus]